MLIEHNGVRVFRDVEFSGRRRFSNTRELQEITICNLIKVYFRNKRSVIYAGSFNPMHDGHVEICQHIGDTDITSHPFVIQMSSTHPEKGTIPQEVIEDRCTDIKTKLKDVRLGYYDIEIVEAPYYASKYALWKESASPTAFLTLVVGHDVWDRYKKGFIKKLGDKDDVEFLVVDRGNKTPFNDSDLLDIMNPLSYTHNMKNAHLSSTQIRNQTKSE